MTYFPNMFPVKYIVPVHLLYIGLDTNASNRSPMTIYFKIAAARNKSMEKCFFSKLGYYRRYFAKYVSSQVNCFIYFITPYSQYDGIKQTPHDHLVQSRDSQLIKQMAAKIQKVSSP